MTASLPVVFIGPMASGKSRIGRRVARALDVPFIDTDRRVAAEHGPIPEIFAEHGEARFRELERAAVVDALGQAAVVSLGGGAVLHPDTRRDLASATVVLLTVSPAAVATRIRGSARPLLAEGGIEAWTRIWEERRPVYEELATTTIDTSTRPMTTIAADVVRWIQEGERS